MRCAVLFLVLLFHQLVHSQTTIIAYKTKNEIYVGADSKGRSYVDSGRVTPVVKPVSVCKIMSVNKFHFAISGVGYPMALEECIKACSENDNISDVMNSFAPGLIRKFQDTLEIIRIMLPDFFKNLITDSKFVSSVYFFGVEGDSLYLVKTEFKLASDLNAPVHITGSGGYLSNGDKATISASGMVDEIKDSILKESVWKGGVVNTIKKLIKVETKYHPDKVEEPIDIIKVTKKGAVWIQRKKSCTE